MHICILCTIAHHQRHTHDTTIAIIIINSGSTKLLPIQQNGSFEMCAWLNGGIGDAHVKLQLINGKHIFCHIQNYAIYTSFQTNKSFKLALFVQCVFWMQERERETKKNSVNIRATRYSFYLYFCFH